MALLPDGADATVPTSTRVVAPPLDDDYEQVLGCHMLDAEDQDVVF
ncbi:MAG: hypothetical protein M9894_33000 [Planctomycetes bacterium]|nr:hypothetical protein [Planctomycetota bacterium]